MKKTFFSLALLLGLFSCTKETDVSTTTKNGSPLMDTDFSVGYGEIHNTFMDYVQNDFVTNDELNSIEEGYSYIISFFEEEVTDYTALTDDEKSFIIDKLNENTDLLHSDYVEGAISNTINVDNPFTNTETTLAVLISDLNGANLISDLEYQTIITLQSYLSGAINGQVDSEEFYAYLDDVQALIEQNQDIEFKLLEPVMDIAFSSKSWWNTNQASFVLPSGVVIESSDDDYEPIPPVALDIAGAVLGGAGSAGVQYVVTGDVNWWTVGGSAVVGAISASTGAVTAFAKFISGFL